MSVAWEFMQRRSQCSERAPELRAEPPDKLSDFPMLFVFGIPKVQVYFLLGPWIDFTWRLCPGNT